MTSNAENRSVAITFAYISWRLRLICACLVSDEPLMPHRNNLPNKKIYFQFIFFFFFLSVSHSLHCFCSVCSADVWRKIRVHNGKQSIRSGKIEQNNRIFTHKRKRMRDRRERETKEEKERATNKKRIVVDHVSSTHQNARNGKNACMCWYLERLNVRRTNVQELNWKRPIDNDEREKKLRS